MHVHVRGVVTGLVVPTDSHVGPISDYLKMRVAMEATPLVTAIQLRALLCCRSGDVRKHPPPPLELSGAHRGVADILAELVDGPTLTTARRVLGVV